MGRRRRRRKQIDAQVILVIVLAILCAVGICGGILWAISGIFHKEEEVPVTETVEIIEFEEETENEETEDLEDPQSDENAVLNETGAETEITKILISENAAETDKITMGIDVSKFQGTIDWKAVADSGIDFAIVRVGYRTQSSGQIEEDTNARYNMQEATKNGLKIGAYFFSTAVSEAEAVEEEFETEEVMADVEEFDMEDEVSFDEMDDEE